MKFSPEVNTIVSTNESKVCGFEVNGKSFSILTSGIYKNKIKAVIREYSTNAVDEHKKYSIDKPFEVHLPTTKEPFFYVQDYANGLDNQEIEDIYCVLFKSTKDNSNLFNGCLGIGAFSAYSYNTKSFTVESVKNGIKYIYNCFIGRSGCPEYTKLYEGSSNEPSGLKVQIPVDIKDIDEFVENAESVYQWFVVPPKFIGKQLELPELFVERNENYGLLKNIRGCYAIMSNVAYPIEAHFKLNAHNEIIKRSAIALFFDNGDISFTPSRESVEYTDRTINAINNKFELIIKEIKESIEAKVANSASEFEAVTKYNHLYEVYGNKFHGAGSWRQDSFNFNGKTLEAKTISIKYDETIDDIDGALCFSQRRKHYNATNIYLNSSHKYVLNDLPKGAISRCAYLSRETGQIVYMFTRGFINKHIPFTTNENDFILASTLDKPPRNNTTYTRSKFDKINLMKCQARLIDAWESVEEADVKSKYYIVKKGYRPTYYGDDRDAKITPSDIYQQATKAGITDQIYGIVEKDEKYFIDSGFTNIRTAIENKYQAIIADIEKNKDFISKYTSIKQFTIRFHQFINNIRSLKKTYSNILNVEEIKEIYNIIVDFDKNVDKLGEFEDFISQATCGVRNYEWKPTPNLFDSKNYEKTIQKFGLLSRQDCNYRYNSLQVEDFYYYTIGVDYASRNV